MHSSVLAPGKYLTTDFFWLKRLRKTPDFALCIGSVQKGRGYSRLLPFYPIEWGICCRTAPAARQVPAHASALNKAGWVTASFHHTLAWLEKSDSWSAAAAARGLQWAQHVEGWHDSSGNRCGL